MGLCFRARGLCPSGGGAPRGHRDWLAADLQARETLPTWLLPGVSAHPSVLESSSLVVQSGPAEMEPGFLFTSKYIPLLPKRSIVVPFSLALALNLIKRPLEKVQVKPAPATSNSF